jgi:hypothetical protein
LALDHGSPGIFNIAEPNAEVLTDKAQTELGWRANMRLPSELARPRRITAHPV